MQAANHRYKQEGRTVMVPEFFMSLLISLSLHKFGREAEKWNSNVLDGPFSVIEMPPDDY